MKEEMEVKRDREREGEREREIDIHILLTLFYTSAHNLRKLRNYRDIEYLKCEIDYSNKLHQVLQHGYYDGFFFTYFNIGLC